jgi:hypothetical protein
MWFAVSSVLTTYSLVGAYQRFKGTCSSSSGGFWKMAAAGFSEMLVITH